MNKLHRGFTLLEVAVVLAVFGVILALVSQTSTGTANRSKAEAMVSTARAIQQTWVQIHARCGTDATDIDVLGDAEDVIFLGDVEPAFQNCWRSAAPADILSTLAGAGVHQINGHTVSLSTGGGNFTVAYADVPDETALLMLRVFEPNAASLPGGAGAGTGYSYGSAVSGRRTFSFVFPLR